MILVEATVISARTGRPEPLGSVLIINDGQGDSEVGSYVIRRSWDDQDHVLCGFRREKGAWELISDALDAFLPGPTDYPSADVSEAGALPPGAGGGPSSVAGNSVTQPSWLKPTVPPVTDSQGTES